MSYCRRQLGLSNLLEKGLTLALLLPLLPKFCFLRGHGEMHLANTPYVSPVTGTGRREARRI